MEKENKCNCTAECECGCQSNAECTCEDSECKKECTCEEKDKKHKKKKHDKELEEKLAVALSTVEELNNKLLREKAEAINYRKRKDEEVSRLLKYKDEQLVLEMLPVIDNFESAIKMDDTNLDDEVSKFLQGFKMIYGNLISILEKYEIKPIDGINKPFDPAYHQAVMTEVCDKEKGTVIDVLRKGYILKDKVLRPAMVKVSEGKGDKNE